MMKKISDKKLFDRLSSYGTAETCQWYAEEKNIPIEYAGYEVARRVFENYDEIEFLKDFELSRRLWAKFLNDEDVIEILGMALSGNKFKRADKIQNILYDLNMHYPDTDLVRDAFYEAFPEIRTSAVEKQEETLKIIKDRLRENKIQWGKSQSVALQEEPGSLQNYSGENKSKVWRMSPMRATKTTIVPVLSNMRRGRTEDENLSIHAQEKDDFGDDENEDVVAMEEEYVDSDADYGDCELDQEEQEEAVCDLVDEDYFLQYFEENNEW